MYRTCTIFATFFYSLCIGAPLPISFDARWPSGKIEQFVAHHGSDLVFCPTWYIDGKPADTNGWTYSLAIQTNGAQSAAWSNIPGVIFSHTNDCGAEAYNVLVRAVDQDGDVNYTAAVRLRMLPSPGFDIGQLPPPEEFQEKDPVFAAWLTANAARLRDIPDVISNTVTRAYVESLGISGGDTGDPADYDVVRTHALSSVQTNDMPMILSGAYVLGAATADRAVQSDFSSSLGEMDSDTQTRSAQNIFSQLDEATTTNAAQDVAIADIRSTQEMTMSYLRGDNMRVVITNDNQALESFPSINFQLADSNNSWRVIWDELTRYNWLVDSYLPTNYFSKGQVQDLLDAKADRMWGYYDSHFGLYVPDGYTWISSPRVAIAGGMVYQRTITAEGSVWVLESRGLVTEANGTTNGFFRVSDDEGNIFLEIKKGDKRTVGAVANSVRTSASYAITHLYVQYAIVSDSPPTLYVCTDLRAAEWKSEDAIDCPANVVWSGSSGNWEAEIYGKTALSQLFVKGTVEIGAETYLQHYIPISTDAGILCTDGIHKVRPVYNNGTISWEIMP